MATARRGPGGRVDDLGRNAPPDEEVDSLAIQPDGRIVLGGTMPGPSGRRDFTLVRLAADGSALDPSFGAGGVAYADFPTGDARLGGLVLRPNGQIVVVGSVGGFGVAQFNADGHLDPSF